MTSAFATTIMPGTHPATPSHVQPSHFLAPATSVECLGCAMLSRDPMVSLWPPVPLSYYYYYDYDEDYDDDYDYYYYYYYYYY